jgi:hypothetical protein
MVPQLTTYLLISISFVPIEAFSKNQFKIKRTRTAQKQAGLTQSQTLQKLTNANFTMLLVACNEEKYPVCSSFWTNLNQRLQLFNSTGKAPKFRVNQRGNYTFN